jgi:hypothetical protein
MHILAALASTFGVAFFWFIGAIPAGAALGLPLPLAALAAWLSYIAGILVVLLIGVRLREALVRRLKLSFEPQPDKLWWRVWNRFGMIGLGLLAPVTLGSQAGTLLGLALGTRPLPLLLAMGLGAAVWTVIITVLASLGIAVAQ